MVCKDGNGDDCTYCIDNPITNIIRDTDDLEAVTSCLLVSLIRNTHDGWRDWLALGHSGVSLMRIAKLKLEQINTDCFTVFIRIFKSV
ncbi:hypothetical protein DPMN_023032 [Dreissena polymorpha]|uniref:Uncharacterized protein n=1 Tax=Dreissena polymorpha TaxID=45954 RepID=A0A9D4LNV9_DREPO|nr:hypothetical protein DPMN_023032 [Dreissena polymorpha]